MRHAKPTLPATSAHAFAHGEEQSPIRAKAKTCAAQPKAARLLSNDADEKTTVADACYEVLADEDEKRFLEEPRPAADANADLESPTGAPAPEHSASATTAAKTETSPCPAAEIALFERNKKGIKLIFI